ncbi:hypothetical protein MUK42_06544 [Musa troglodytarum]|nr:hypothetical protein MUK42_06544 [Musa troglodytarum]
MDCGYNSPNFHGDDDSSCDSGRKIIVHPLYLPKSSPWLDLKVFYVRLSNYEFNESIPEHLTIKHISLTADTILEVNGRRSGISSDCVSCLLRRDRIDKKSEEVTFVSTDCVRMTGSVRYDVCDGDDMLLSGVLELSNHNDLDVELKKHKGKWSMRCHTVATAAYHFYDGNIKGSEVPSPIIEVYVAGCSSGTPIILTKTIQLCCQKKHCRTLAQNSFLEDESMELKKEFPMEDVLKVSGYEAQRWEKDADTDYYSLHSDAAYIEEEDGELSWFNAGVKVGVGISVGVCLGIGIGVACSCCGVWSSSQVKKLVTGSSADGLKKFRAPIELRRCWSWLERVNSFVLDLVERVRGTSMSVAELKERHIAATATANSLRDRLRQRRQLLVDTDGGVTLFMGWLHMLGAKGDRLLVLAPSIWFAAGPYRVILARFIGFCGLFVTLNRMPCMMLRKYCLPVYSLDWTPERNRIVSASQVGRLIVWNALTSQKTHAIKLQCPWVVTCAFAPNGQSVACGGLNSACSVFNLNSQVDRDGKIPVSRILTGHKGYVYSCQYVLDQDTRLITSSGDQTCILWDVTTGQRISVFGGEFPSGHTADVLR